MGIITNRVAVIRKASDKGLEIKTEKSPFDKTSDWRNASSNIDRALHSDSDLWKIFP